MASYYDILEINRNATPEDIKKAFRKQAFKFHPDRNKSPGASDKFKKINEAYQVLSNSEQKAVYDRFGKNGLRNGGSSTNGFEGFSNFGGLGDLFQEFFGGTRFAGGHRRGENLNAEIDISLADVLTGVTEEISLHHWNICSHCEGTRAEPNSVLQQCSECRGTGQIHRTHAHLFGQFSQTSICSTCSGAGTIPSVVCTHCKGQGRIRMKKTIAVNVPAGIEDGTTIQLRGAGNAGAQPNQNGDILVLVRVKLSKGLERDGTTLLSIQAIDISMATLGGEIDVPGVDREPISLKIPSGTQPGSVFKIRGAGFPSLNRPEQRGDHRVTITVDVPKRLSPTQKRIFEDLRDALHGSNANNPRNKAQRQGKKSSVFNKLRDAINGA